MALRTCIIDEFIQFAIGQGVDTILNLGAGLDTRPYRMTLPESLQWIEVDYPHMIQLKKSRLANKAPNCKLESIELDLADHASRKRLLLDIGSRTNQTLVLTEGVVPYLSNDETAALADDLFAQQNFNYWIVDYSPPRCWKCADVPAQQMIARTPLGTSGANGIRPCNNTFGKVIWVIRSCVTARPDPSLR